MQKYKVISKFNEDKKLESAKWFSEHTGIGMNSTYNLLNRKDAPVIRIGRRLFVIRDRVDSWLESLIGEIL